MSKLYPRWRMMWKRRFSSRRRMTREDKAKEEMAWRKINEDIELEREGVEPLLDSYFVYATEVLCMVDFTRTAAIAPFGLGEESRIVRKGVTRFMHTHAMEG